MKGSQKVRFLRVWDYCVVSVHLRCDFQVRSGPTMLSSSLVTHHYGVTEIYYEEHSGSKGVGVKHEPL